MTGRSAALTAEAYSAYFNEKLNNYICAPRNSCNSILVNANCRNLNTLQAVMNTAARLIYGGRSSDHITPLLRNLHWLRIPDRITFKILLLVYRAATGSAPQYLTELLTSTSTIPLGHPSGPPTTGLLLFLGPEQLGRKTGRSLSADPGYGILFHPSSSFTDNRLFNPLLKTYLFSRSSCINFDWFLLLLHFLGNIFYPDHSMEELNCRPCLL